VLEKQIDLSYASLALPKQLKDLRAGAGLSQAEVAERAGISAAHLSRIESGKIKNLEIRTVLRLAAVCGATVLVTFVDNLPHR
jgi:transcriptional regulator with XRE-family HTH domain